MSLDGEWLAFFASGNQGEQGIYAVDPNGSTSAIVDTATEIPGGQLGTFTGFGPNPSFHDGRVALLGSGAQVDGLYLLGPNGPATLADTTTTLPGGQGRFAYFGKPSLAGEAVAFHGISEYQEESVYLGRPGNAPIVLANANGPVTGLSGINGVAWDGGHLAVVASGSLLTDLSGGLRPLFSPGEVLDGKPLAQISIGPDALYGDLLVFRAAFTDGSEGIFLAEFAGVDLQIDAGQGPGDARLHWTGGLAPFVVFRASAPQGVVNANSELGRTSQREWFDAPPQAGVEYYLIQSLACIDDRECTSGFCRDGFCCDLDCNGACESCGEAGSEGACSPASCP